MSNIGKKIRYSDCVDPKNSDVVFPFSGSDMHIELFSNGKMLFEGKYSIIEYLDERVVFKAGKKTVKLDGSRLRLKNLVSESFTVIGNIMSIEFE